MWIFIIIGLGFIAAGLAVHKLRWHFLIAGYNTMAKEKQDNVDIEGLSKFFGIFCYTNGAVFILAGMLMAADFEWAPVVAIGFLCLSIVYLLIRAQKYDGNIYDSDGKLRKNAGIQLILPVSIAILVFLSVFGFMWLLSRPTKVSLSDDYLQIHGVYGEVYQWQKISSVSLHENLPVITKRTNGSDVFSNLKGHFKTEEFGAVKLFVNTKMSSYIYMETEEGIVIFNGKDLDETQYLYNEILEHING